jgi:CRISPR type I-E-associated protein CasB/Cse2
LRTQLGDSDGATLRFRRLLDSRDPDDLDHRLRGIVRLAAGDHTPLDWGVFGTDILWFFAESDSVRRRWAQDFYAPTSREASPRAVPSSTASTPTA